MEAQKAEELSELKSKHDKKVEKLESISNAKITDLQNQNSDLSSRLQASEKAHNMLNTEHELLKQQNEENLRLINDLK